MPQLVRLSSAIRSALYAAWSDPCFSIDAFAASDRALDPARLWCSSSSATSAVWCAVVMVLSIDCGAPSRTTVQSCHHRVVRNQAPTMLARQRLTPRARCGASELHVPAWGVASNAAVTFPSENPPVSGNSAGEETTSLCG